MTSELDSELKRWLVKHAEEDLDQAAEKWKKGKKQPGKTATSQLRNLVQMTQTESDVPVLANFLRYQASRRASKDLWMELHSQVIASLEEIERKTRDAETRRLAIQHYFGYLTRHYVYLTRKSK